MYLFEQPKRYPKICLGIEMLFCLGVIEHRYFTINAFTLNFPAIPPAPLDTSDKEVGNQPSKGSADPLEG